MENDKEIMKAINILRKRVQKDEGKDVKKIAVFDFDGTILRGDMTEGSKPCYGENHPHYFKGLAELTILNGLGLNYPSGEDEWHRYLSDYTSLLQKPDLSDSVWFCAANVDFDGSDSAHSNSNKLSQTR